MLNPAAGKWVALLILILLTFLAFRPGLKGDFTNWDDDRYVKNNELIQQGSLGEILTEYYMGNYHPLTLLSYHLEYKMAGKEPYLYHLTNLILHILNVVMVYFLALLLFKGKWMGAWLAAALFAVHPLHVESVSWVSERKDVLYAFFFLPAWYAWIQFRKTETPRWAVLSLVLFVLSCLSKGMAVTFSGVIIFTDLLLKGKWEVRDAVWYIPFLAVSVFFGVLAIFAQQAAGFIYLETQWSALEKGILAAYAWWFYLWKMINPLHLSAFYPFPEKVGGSLPGIFWLAPLMLMGLGALLILYRKKMPWLLFAFGVYSACIVIVLQILSVGEALAADRYFYVASCGFFLAAGYGLNYVLENKPQYKTMATSLSVGIVLALAWMTTDRTLVWKDSLTLWKDTLGKYERISLAHYNLGVTYGLEMNDYANAEPHFRRAIEIRPGYPQALYNLAIIHANRNQFEESNKLFRELLQVNPAYPLAHSGIGFNLEKMGQYAEAAEAYQQELANSNESYNVWLGLGTSLGKAGKLEEAVPALQKASELDPTRPEPWVNMGVFHFNAGRLSDALPLYDKALEINVANPEAWFNKGSALNAMGRLDDAETCFRKALEYNPRMAEVFINLGNIASVRGNPKGQTEAYQQAARLGHGGAQSWLSARNIQW